MLFVVHYLEQLVAQRKDNETMPNHKVRWEIDIAADTAEEAAQQARIEQLRKATEELPSFFSVTSEFNETEGSPSVVSVVDEELEDCLSTV